MKQTKLKQVNVEEWVKSFDSYFGDGEPNSPWDKRRANAIKKFISSLLQESLEKQREKLTCCDSCWHFNKEVTPLSRDCDKCKHLWET